tara:strand:+ start:11822 stop:12070 length:249 start_codon:yes stop_codon:yes gene_type:complete
MDDTESLARSYAARLLSYEDVEKSAQEMFDIVEQVIHDDKEYEKTKRFILQIVRVMDEIDPDYNYAVAKAYYKKAKDVYGAE